MAMTPAEVHEMLRTHRLCPKCEAGYLAPGDNPDAKVCPNPGCEERVGMVLEAHVPTGALTCERVRWSRCLLMNAKTRQRLWVWRLAT